MATQREKINSKKRERERKREKNKNQGQCWTQAGPLLFLKLIPKPLYSPRGPHVTIWAEHAQMWSWPQPLKRLITAAVHVMDSPTKTIILKYYISICNKYIYWNIQPLPSIYFNIQIKYIRKKKVTYTVVSGGWSRMMAEGTFLIPELWEEKLSRLNRQIFTD